jgi:hypothetical protein
MRCRVDNTIHTLGKVCVTPTALHLERWQQATLCDVLLPLDGICEASKYIPGSHLSAQLVIVSKLFYAHMPQSPKAIHSQDSFNAQCKTSAVYFTALHFMWIPFLL